MYFNFDQTWFCPIYTKFRCTVLTSALCKIRGIPAADVYEYCWCLTPCSLSEIHLQFIRTGRFHLQGSAWRKTWYVLVNNIYTGCHRRNGPNFGRVFLMLNYTDITQNTYIQSWTVTEIMAREKCGHLAFPRTVRLQLCSALNLTEQCSTHLCACTSSAQRDKIVFHYCRYSCAMYSAW